MSRRGLSYEELLKELEDLPQYESDCELPFNNNSTDENSDFVIDVPESQKSSSDSDETTPPLSTLTRRNSNTDIASLSEATVDAVTDIGEQLIFSIAFGELMVITVILHPMDRECINAYMLAVL
ncbi:hypothetical protein FQA39_LY11129 [Lamprigera yunnana]|nr:hypothetical protein FQA39_LY11129 [Lamprigera yunnana]